MRFGSDALIAGFGSLGNLRAPTKYPITAETATSIIKSVLTLSLLVNLNDGVSFFTLVFLVVEVFT